MNLNCVKIRIYLIKHALQSNTKHCIYLQVILNKKDPNGQKTKGH